MILFSEFFGSHISCVFSRLPFAISRVGGTFTTTTFDDADAAVTLSNCLPWSNRRLDKRNLPLAWMSQLSSLDIETGDGAMQSGDVDAEEGTGTTTRPTRSDSSPEIEPGMHGV
jgi:hypothetical protein